MNSFIRTVLLIAAVAGCSRAVAATFYDQDLLSRDPDRRFITVMSEKLEASEAVAERVNNRSGWLGLGYQHLVGSARNGTFLAGVSFEHRFFYHAGVQVMASYVGADGSDPKTQSGDPLGVQGMAALAIYLWKPGWVYSLSVRPEAGYFYYVHPSSAQISQGYWGGSVGLQFLGVFMAKMGVQKFSSTDTQPARSAFWGGAELVIPLYQ